MVFEFFPGLLEGADDFEDVDGVEDGDAGFEGDEMGVGEVFELFEEFGVEDEVAFGVGFGGLGEEFDALDFAFLDGLLVVFFPLELFVEGFAIHTL